MRRNRIGYSKLLASVACAVMFITAVASARAGLFDDEVARKQILEQQKRIDELKQQNETLLSRLAQVEDGLKEALRNQPLLDLVAQIEMLRQELKTLRGQIEVLGNNIESVSKQQRDMYVDLDSRLRRLEQPASASVPPAATVAPPAAAAPAAADAAESRVYEAAHNQRRIGNYRGAIVAFQNFLEQYPKSELAPRAQYWIGDSYFNLRDFRNAIASQQKLLNTYPDSASVPDALLNIASSQMELGDAAAARKTMEGLVSRYPSSEAAEKARRRLAALK
ncbi:MAG: tol-pal system protein YbgF [Burkholderiales bacterium]